MDFDLDQPTGQLCGSTPAPAMTRTPLVMVRAGARVLSIFSLALARLPRKLKASGRSHC